MSDLTSWRFEGAIYRRTDDPSNAGDDAPLFAPDVVQGPDGRYYLYYALASMICGRPSRIGVAVCDEPAGHFRFLGDVALPDGSFLDETSGYGMPFDPATYVECDGVWLYWGFGAAEPFPGVGDAATQGGFVVRLLPDMVTMAEEPKRSVPSVLRAAGTSFEAHPFYEASSFRKVGGRYYFVYSSFLSHELCWAWAETPEGPFSFGGTLHSNGDVGMPGVPTNAEATYYLGNNHGGLVQVGDTLYVFGHRQTHGCESARQGVAERVNAREDGFLEQAEMTSCGLNGGPLPATRETPAYCCCHLRSAQGAVRYAVDEYDKELHPVVWQEAAHGCATDAYQYVRNLRDGAEVGYRYLDFGEGVAGVATEVRGDFAGEVSVRIDAPTGPEVARVAVSQDASWHWVDAKLSDVPLGVHALYLVPSGEGSLDLRAIRFSC